MNISSLSFDELNKLVGMKRSEDFARYFAPMKLTEEQKRQRIELADRLEDEFLFVLAWMFESYPNINTDMVEELKDRYIDALVELGIITNTATEIATAAEQEHRLQAEKFAADTVTATAQNKDDPYFYSHDRARLLAEGEANTVYNLEEYDAALLGGLMLKTWETAGDTHVRDSHQEIEGTTIPIDEPFEVGGYYMQYPRDGSMGAGAEEIANCRCSLTYTDAGVALIGLE